MTSAPLRLPGRSVEVLESVYQHRLLSTAQLNVLHTPGATARTTQRLLTALDDHGLVAWARGEGRTKLWYLTEQGIDAVEAIPTRAEQRRKLITAAQAAGPLQQHTLAVNDVAISYLHAARDRGDEFGPLSWRHEIAHPIGATPGRRGGEQLIADALLTYLHTNDEGVVQHQRFLELDRATIPIDALLAKLHRYQRLRTYTPDARPGHDTQPAWQSTYPARLPDVQIVLAHKPRRTLERRTQLLFALAASDPQLASDRHLHVAIALLDDLQQHGPFAQIWLQLNDPSRRVDWLGRAARSRR